MTGQQSRRRLVARVVLLDEAGEVLLLHTRDPEPPHQEWLLPPGGGIEVGEEPAAAARRELLEETGLVAGELEHLATVTTEYRFKGFLHRQEEHLYVVRVPSGLAVRRPQHLVERDVLLGHRWVPDTELATLHGRLHPPQLAQLLPAARDRAR
jgi:8-oxo-dGTP pyrophosphatase MutT (NUDIX family)